MESGAPVYSIGYSNRSIEQFLALLRENSVTAIADVRSQPFSRSNPAFRQDLLRDVLRSAGISYAFLGKELGARAPDEGCYVAGKVQYDLLAATSAFQAGLDRIQSGRNLHRIALMCAESDPLTCHRCILVARHLSARGVVVRHILEHGSVEDHESTARRLVQILRVPEVCSSGREEDLLGMAYQIQGERIAWRKDLDESVQYELWGQESD